ncbi:hypothetical protein WJ58_03775 [Burkholderia ubonensis]|uniref:winged helix-turn-helix domain-containing protein n=1 Tax=Burkholderia ubonensis TaxID=101571 RepID=UPI00075A64A3|nr:winged helix-turn-helix domain-containing protein [Burkholderia ubonensis]KVM61913.1 hypothetical protein WJ58_03775 [Burkholderia ubonensis]
MIKIGHVSVSLAMREVYVEDRTVIIGSRAFDLLECLILSEGKTLTKGEIFDRVWPNSIVEENNIHVQISLLRKILGIHRGAIQTIPGRGYRFVMPVDAGSNRNRGSVPPDSVRCEGGKGLPGLDRPLIGRDRLCGDVILALQDSSIVTLVGVGGVGKTQVALTVGRSIAHQAGTEVRCVSLASVHTAHCIMKTVADALGIAEVGGNLSARTLAAATQGRNLLVLLDNCEHVIESAAIVAELLVENNPDVRVLATSREPLRTRGEKVCWVRPLDTPSAGATLQEIVACDSTSLFLRELRALDASLEIDPGVLEMISTVCRRLDGVPFALELAAAHANVFGVRRLLADLDNRFHALTNGRRTALPRQQTLKATLDWSYALLTDDEKVVLQVLSAFPGQFALDEACAVAASAIGSAIEVTDAIIRLAWKCLVMTAMDGTSRRYFLLETTRDYALRKLYESDYVGDILASVENYRQSLQKRRGSWVPMVGSIVGGMPMTNLAPSA